MWTRVGIFTSFASAKSAVEGLLAAGVPQRSIAFLSKGNEAGTIPESELDRVPTTDAERDGMGKAVGALLGGGVGASAGLGGGAAIASMLVPGVGTIFAIGLGAAALLGLGGAAAGAKLGDVSEHALDLGVAKDDVALYHELLRRGYALVIANLDSEELADKTNKILKGAGSEDLDETRRGLSAA